MRAPPRSARSPTAARPRNRLASSEPMPMAKTITDSTTEAWVTESPNKYEASATSSSSYTSPQAAQMKTAAEHEEPAGPAGAADGAIRAALPRSGTHICWSIMTRTLRHDGVATCHPQGCKCRARRTCSGISASHRRRAHAHAGAGDHQLPLLRVRMPGAPAHLALRPLREHGGEGVRATGERAGEAVRMVGHQREEFLRTPREGVLGERLDAGREFVLPLPEPFGDSERQRRAAARACRPPSRSSCRRSSSRST